MTRRVLKRIPNTERAWLQAAGLGWGDTPSNSLAPGGPPQGPGSWVLALSPLGHQGRPSLDCARGHWQQTSSPTADPRPAAEAGGPGAWPRASPEGPCPQPDRGVTVHVTVHAGRAAPRRCRLGQPLPADAGRAVGQRRTRKLSAPGRQGAEYHGLWNDAVQHGGPGQPHVYLTVEYTRLVFKIRFLSHISHVCSRSSNATRGRHRSPHGWASWDTPGTAENTRAARSRGSRGLTAQADHGPGALVGAAMPVKRPVKRPVKLTRTSGHVRTEELLGEQKAPGCAGHGESGRGRACGSARGPGRLRGSGWGGEARAHPRVGGGWVARPRHG